tara:strand:+ start:535 stop:1437 length:903 start_codon:yes stop_codon:yes gene_type:complete
MLKELQSALNQIILGKQEVIKLSISCLLAKGHLLLEDIPGMGKTTLSHALAHLTGMKYRRIQFTSDLLPTDLIGVSIFDSENQIFKFHQGPIFSQFILADEINRATPKTQSALLEAMEENQVTTDSRTIKLPDPFFVIATQNPTFQTGTFPLPESQLDRFLMRISIGYPSHDAERKLLTDNDPRKKLFDIPAVVSPDELLQWQNKIEDVNLSSPMLDYIQHILKVSRDMDWFLHGLSPRAGRAIMMAAQAYAMVDDRDFVRPDDIQAILGPVINHRLIFLKSENELYPSEAILNHVEVPI